MACPTLHSPTADLSTAPTQPETVEHRRRIDRERATAAVADLVEALGLDPSTPGLADTPRRIADAYAELLSPVPFRPTTFPNDAGYDELVLVRDIPFVSVCEHHLLPFRGTAHVGYLPGDRVIGLSKLARLVETFARRPQVQERLTVQIADWLDDHLAPRGAGVVVEAEHLCMSIRGVRSSGARTVTSAMYGLLRDRPAARQEFLDLTRRP
jgi:GTP cyclohydrolase I